MIDEPPKRSRSRWRRVALISMAVLVGLLLTLALVLGLALATMDRWFMTVLDPGPFDPAASPPAPNYADAGAWAALPELDDGADVALLEYPAIDQRTAEVAVFYLHPTTAIAPEWNAAFDDPAVIEATTRGGTLIQASVFNACCAVYAPRYRQANGRAFVHPDAHGDAAIDLAFADVAAAFDEFLRRIEWRPFIIAGHSQGAVLGARLVRERISGTPLQARLVAAYLPGAPIRDGMLGEVPLCETPKQTGCAVSWHARGPGYVHSRLELEADSPDPMRDRACVNPISWSTDAVQVPARRNAGAVFFDTEAPRVMPGFADAQCVGGRLIVTEHGDLQRDLASKILLWVMGPENYHPIEYQLFYLDIRANALARARAWAPPHH